MSSEKMENVNPLKKLENSLTQEQLLNINEVFKNNPEISILFKNNKKLYQEYLNSIFPDSKVKEIVWHGTDSKIEKYDFNKEANRHTSDITDKKVASFTKDKYEAEFYAKKTKNPIVVAAVLDVADNKANEIRPTNIINAYEPEQIHILGSKQDIEQAKEFLKNK